MKKLREGRVILFINGQLLGNKEFYHNYILSNDLIVVADGGANYTFELGITPNLILGDLDSIRPEVLEYYQQQQVQFDTYPIEKDQSDTQLILKRLTARGYDNIIVMAALGGRIDHSLANIFLLERFARKGLRIRFVTPSSILELITTEYLITNKKGATISLIPITEEVSDVNLIGFKYPLFNTTFKRGDTLSLSNVIIEEIAEIKFDQGKLLLIINN